MRKREAGKRLNTEAVAEAVLDELRLWIEGQSTNRSGYGFEEYFSALGYSREKIAEIRMKSLMALDNVGGELTDLSAVPLSLVTLKPEELYSKLGLGEHMEYTIETTATGKKATIKVLPNWYDEYGNLVHVIGGYLNRFGLDKRWHNSLVMTTVANFAVTSANAGVVPNTVATFFATDMAQEAIQRLAERGVIDLRDVTNPLRFREKLDNIDLSELRKVLAETWRREYYLVHKTTKETKRITVSEAMQYVSEKPIPPPPEYTLGVGGISGRIATAQYADRKVVSAMNSIMELLYGLIPEEITGANDYQTAIGEAYQALWGERFSPKANKTRSYGLNLSKAIELPNPDSPIPSTFNAYQAIRIHATNTRDTWMQATSGSLLKVLRSPEGQLDYDALNGMLVSFGVMADADGTVKPIPEIWNNPTEAEEIMRILNLQRQPELRQRWGDVRFTTGEVRFVRAFLSTPAFSREKAQREAVKMAQHVVDSLRRIFRIASPREDGGITIHLDALTNAERQSVRGSVVRLVSDGVATLEGNNLHVPFDSLSKYGKTHTNELSAFGSILKKHYEKMGSTPVSAFTEQFISLTDEDLNMLRNNGRRMRQALGSELSQLRKTTTQRFVSEKPTTVSELVSSQPLRPEQAQACIWGISRIASAKLFGTKSVGLGRVSASEAE